MDEEARPALVSAAELARILSVSTQKVYLMAGWGEIPALKVGRAWRFDPTAVIAALAATPAHIAPIRMPGQPVVGWAQSRQSLARRRVQ